MIVIFKILKALTLPLFIVSGAILGTIGVIKFWHLWTFKDVKLFKYLNNDGK